MHCHCAVSIANIYNGLLQLLHIVVMQAISRNALWFLLRAHLTGPSHWEAPHTKGKKSKISAPKGSQWCLLAAQSPTAPGEGAGIHIGRTSPLLLQRQWCCTTFSIICWHLYCEINIIFFAHTCKKILCYVHKDLHRLQILKLSIGLGSPLPVTTKSHCLPSSLLAPFKIHQGWLVPAGMVVRWKPKREERNQPQSTHRVIHLAVSAYLQQACVS